MQGTGTLLSFKTEHDGVRTWDTQKSNENTDMSLAFKFETSSLAVSFLKYHNMWGKVNVSSA